MRSRAGNEAEAHGKWYMENYVGRSMLQSSRSMLTNETMLKRAMSFPEPCNVYDPIPLQRDYVRRYMHSIRNLVRCRCGMIVSYILRLRGEDLE